MSQVDPVSLGRVVEEISVRLYAGAALGSFVRTDVDVGDPNSFGRQSCHYIIVDRIDLLPADQTVGDAADFIATFLN